MTPPAPPPPPPPPAPAPPPASSSGPPPGFRIVPGLGDALHDMKKRLTGHEETPAAAEGVSALIDKPLLPSGKARPKSWYGSQVPGKPRRDNDFINEMQSKLSKRKNKVDAESYVVETPDHLVAVETSAPSGSRRETPPTDYSPFMQRRSSKDSGRCSMTPSCDGDPQRRFSVDFNQYRRVSVDLERKEELILAKQVRKSSAKMLRSSPSPWEQNVESPSTKIKAESPSEVVSDIPEASPVVMRYWKQCAGADTEEKQLDDENDNEKESWKTEDDITEFPSIKDKIANMEDVGKSVGQFFVPDVKSRVKQRAPPAAGWMEARSKLQTQLDSLIAKTSAKMSKYGTVHAVEPKEVPPPKEQSPALPKDVEPEQRKKPPINPALTSLIKSVANEIQKSFSSKSLANRDDDEEEGEEEEKDGICDENNNSVDDTEYWRNKDVSKPRQPQIDVEAPIDFDYEEPLKDKCEEEVVGEEKEEEVKEEKAEECTEEPDDKEQSDSNPMVLDASLARSKANLMRRTERRLPGHVLAKRRAAEKARGHEEISVMEQIKRELADASQQVDLLNHEHDLETLEDEEKVDLIAKHMSKMESGYIMKLLKQLEAGILDISVPMLLPFLSLQVKLDLGRNIFKSLEPQNKEKVVKENFINDMISDITDIALLQEVIDRTQEKINFLCPPKPQPTISGEYYNIENDSFELPSPALNIENDSYELTDSKRDHQGLTEVLSHIEKLMKEGSKTAQDRNEVKREEETIERAAPTEPESKVDETENIDDSVPSDESDESLPESQCKSNILNEEEEKKSEVEEKEEIVPEKEECEKEKIEEEVEIKNEEPKVVKKQEQDDIKLEDSNKASKTAAPKENNETVIKQKLRNILENCKTNEQTRPGRNFGRNFEFQNVQLKPVVPNDKRTSKAKRMDDMWMNSIASKQKWPCNNQLSAPKPKVPWTMNKNTQPQKKETNTEVKEFEKCHKNLKDVESKQISTVKEVIQKSSSKIETQVTERVEKDNNEEIKEKVKEKPGSSEQIDKAEVESKEKDRKGVENTIQPEPEEKAKLESSDDKCLFKNESTSEDEKAPLSKEKSKYKQPQIDMESPVDFGPLDISHLEKGSLEVPKSKDSSRKNDVITRADNEKTPANIKTDKVEAPKDPASVPSTPIVRRRGDTFTVVIPLREKPPPPPMVKPPPPPMSPPVPAARVQELELENKMGKVDKKENTEVEVSEEEEEEEESEWEWTEEETDDEEEGNTYEVNKEGWENIMSTSQGPTTFKAEYSVKVGGR